MSLDLQHVAALLEGHGPLAPVEPARGRARQQQRGNSGSRGEGGRQGRSWPPQAQQAPSGTRSGSRQGSKRQQSGRGAAQHKGKGRDRGRAAEPSAAYKGQSGSSTVAAATPPEASGGEPYNQPGTQSTHKVWHCVACDVWVPRRAGDWETHVRGIRHQRQLLSLRVHGERGKLVLSAFESLPGPSDPAYRLVGKGAAQFELGQGPFKGQSRPRQALRQGQLQAARRLRTQALAQLLNLFGVGQTYNAAGQELSESQLAEALAAVEPSPGGTARRGSQGSPPQLGQAQGELLLRTPATLAAAAEQVQEQGYSRTQAHLQVNLEGQSFAGIAAAFAALRLLLGALGSAPTLAHLTISLKCSALQAMPGYQLNQLERAWGSHVVQGLGALLERHPAIRTIRLEVPPILEAPTQQQLPSLQSAAHAAPLAARQHLLLALHPRVGRCSVLQLLPLPLVGHVLDLTAPLEPCSIEVHAALPDGE